jgi:hypothetical protein
VQCGVVYISYAEVENIANLMGFPHSGLSDVSHSNCQIHLVEDMCCARSGFSSVAVSLCGG